MPGLANLQFRDPLSRMDSANLEGMAGLLGMWANNEQNNARTQQAQALESNNLKNIQEAIATRQAQALDNPADIDILRRGKLGQALSQDATGKYDQGVLPGRIATANAENKTKLSTAQLEDMVHQLDIAASALEVGGPQGIASIPDESLRSKVAQISQKTGKNPLQVVQAMSNSVKSALANSPKFMADANLEAIKASNHLNNTALSNKGHLAVQESANAAAAARQDKDIAAGKYANKGKGAALDSIQQLIKNGRYESGAQGLHLMSIMEEDPVLAAKYEAEAKKFEQMELDKQAAKAAGKIDLGAASGLPVIKPPPPRLGTQQENKPDNSATKVYDEKTKTWK